MQFDRHGIRFQYPENWTVVDDQSADDLASVTVQSVHGGFWSVSAYEGDLAPVQLVQQTLTTMQQEYEDLEADAIEEQVADHHAAGYEMRFFYLDLLITARVLAWQQGGRSVMVMYQAESREFDNLEMIFSAISTSLAQSL